MWFPSFKDWIPSSFCLPLVSFWYLQMGCFSSFYFFKCFKCYLIECLLLCKYFHHYLFWPFFFEWEINKLWYNLTHYCWVSVTVKPSPIPMDTARVRIPSQGNGQSHDEFVVGGRVSSLWRQVLQPIVELQKAARWQWKRNSFPSFGIQCFL